MLYDKSLIYQACWVKMAGCYARFVFFSRFFGPVFAYLCTLSHKNAKKEKKLSQCPAILSSRLANHAYILSFFKDSNNVVQAFSSLRAFTPVKFRFSCTKIMHTNEIDSAHNAQINSIR